MRALLDTHVFLWWITDDPRLSVRAREVISEGRNELFFRAASGWEIAIKAGIGRLEIPEDLERFVAEQLFVTTAPRPRRYRRVRRLSRAGCHAAGPCR